MAAAGFNTLRTYTVPPRGPARPGRAPRPAGDGRAALGAAHRVPRRPGRARAIERTVARGRARRAPATRPSSRYAIGNEIPASIVRWHGRAARRATSSSGSYRAAKDEDPGALVTYVNFPTTEYLQLPFLDFFAFNVYLERAGRPRPLPRPPAEPRRRPAAADGRDRARQPAQRRGRQAEQIRTGRCAPRSAPGCAGAFVFAWTDEWYRGGHDIDDWDFGLVDARPQPEAGAARSSPRRCADVAAPAAGRLAADLRRRLQLQRRAHDRATACDGLRGCDYPDFEVDRRRRRLDRRHARRSPTSTGVRVITHREPRPQRRAQHRLRARHAARSSPTSTTTRWPDPALAALPRPHASRRPTHAAVGGPNIPPPGRRHDRRLRRAVRRAARCTCCSTTRSPSTSPAATWPSAATRWRRSAASTRSSAPPATTSTCAGACRKRGWTRRLQPRGDGLAPPAQLGAGLTGASSAATARPRRCSSASGRRSTTVLGHVAWHGRIYGPGPIHAAAALAASTTAPGGAGRSRRLYAA